MLAAVKNFAREEFGLKHRYAMVLHTDEPHPHVHVVVKSASEQGVRLNIRKATLREWRREFARHLRALGVSANATEPAVRGQTRKSKLDSIYRAEQRGVSHHSSERAESFARQLRHGGLRVEPGKRKLITTRREVERGWDAVGDILVSEGMLELARHVRQFVAGFGLPRTEREEVAAILRNRDRHPPDMNLTR